MNKDTDKDIKTICLTPVKNGEWMIDKFIQCASLWADFIIISDQNSSDNTVEIAKKYPKTIVINNNQEIFDEVFMRQNLLDEARKIECDKRIIIYLDSDEILSANFKTSVEWKTIISQNRGTFFTSKLINFYPNFETYFSPNTNFQFGFIDSDELNFDGPKIHGLRVPIKEGAKIINLFDVKILHLPYLNFDRVEAKNCWYKCVELIHNEKISSIALNRKYDISTLFDVTLKPTNPNWLNYYIENEVNVYSEVNYLKDSWYYDEILNFFEIYGTKKFQNLDIWMIDWESKALKKGVKLKNRSFKSKLIRKYSKFSLRKKSVFFKVLDKIINKLS